MPDMYVRVELEELSGSGDSDSGLEAGVTAWAMATWVTLTVPLPVRLPSRWLGVGRSIQYELQP